MGRLSEVAIAHYREHGYYAPIQVMTAAEVEGVRHRLEAHEAEHGPLKGSIRHKSHLLFTWLDRLIRHPAILDAVEDVLGPDILKFMRESAAEREALNATDDNVPPDRPARRRRSR